MNKRSSGILLHISSLNNNFGIGSFGKEAYEFVDFLVKSGQKYWQILPLGHTSYGDSPYQCFSSIAGNPNFINLDLLQKDGLLKKEEYENIDFGEDIENVDYGKLFKVRKKILYKAYERFKKVNDKEYCKFIEENEFWVRDYSEYMAIKNKMNLKAWREWDKDIRNREEKALEMYRKTLSDEINFYKFIQYEFFKQWKNLKSYANENGIEIIGDLPIYVAEDSADMWVNPKMFKVDVDNNPKFVAGCPPDCFSEDGQLWGNPIYNWDEMEKEGFSWWIMRIRENLKLYDVLRLDHFIGFNSYWQIPAQDKTAKNGKWIKGPGIRLFNKIKEELGEVNIIAEDLGVITDEFLEFKKKTGFRGMNILQFAFGEYNSKDLSYNHKVHSVSYVGTHDNETSRGWYLNNRDTEEGKRAKEFLEIEKEDEIGFKNIKSIWSAPSEIAIATMQDLLEIGNEGRMNTPSTLGGNWCWRMKEGVLTKELCEKLYKITRIYGRVSYMNNPIKRDLERNLKIKFGVSIDKANEEQIMSSLSTTLLERVVDNWEETTDLYREGKQAFYLSAEYLMGRALGNNLISMGLYKEVKDLLKELNIDINRIEEAEEDAALGNGGLGRLAACFMDSAATMEMPIRGYGLRYSNGLFKQYFKDGFQFEKADSWLKYGDPWSIRKENEKILVKLDNMDVFAVPYDTPIIGYDTKNINTLRLWKCEPLEELDFEAFNAGEYDEAVSLKNKADDITRILYPNDDKKEGKMLRLKQQYFLASASVQDIVREFEFVHGKDYSKLSEYAAIQLNDTHPVISIPELIRILVDEKDVKLEDAIKYSRKIFAYTNHTILAEALEKWDVELIEELSPRILEIIEAIDKNFEKELEILEYTEEEIEEFKIIEDEKVRMANLAIHIGFAVNGVAQLHTEILKNTELNNWYKLYPNKFQNKTNGITPRRWLRLCNKELSELITELIGDESWVKDLSKLKSLEKYADDEEVLNRFMAIKKIKKTQLADYIEKTSGVKLNPDSLFDIQVKRLHEYKRQLLNTLYVLDLYYRLKENPDMDIPAVTFIYGAKAFPGYKRAKAIIKFTNDVAELINNDKDIKDKIKVVFVENYRVSYAEKLFPAADLSKQISTAGKEASGTGNMKFMLNGAPTFGTMDGANVEIVREAGKDNNFIFGLTVEGIEEIQDKYESKDYYKKDKSLKRVIDTLIDGTFDDEETGLYEDLYESLIKENDQYYLLADFESFKETEDKVFKAYKNKKAWAKICFENMCNAGIFSSDRTILEYCKDIWHIEKKKINKTK